jgi:hypothetical protein
MTWKKTARPCPNCGAYIYLLYDCAWCINEKCALRPNKAQRARAKARVEERRAKLHETTDGA